MASASLSRAFFCVSSERSSRRFDARRVLAEASMMEQVRSEQLVLPTSVVERRREKKTKITLPDHVK